MITNRVQTVLHTAARGDVDHNNAWHAVWMQPDSTYHNQLLTTHMGTVRVSKTKHTMEISSKSFLAETWSLVMVSEAQQTWVQEGAAHLFSPSRSLLQLVSGLPCHPGALLLCSALQTPHHHLYMSMQSESDEPLVLRPLLGSINDTQWSCMSHVHVMFLLHTCILEIY